MKISGMHVTLGMLLALLGLPPAAAGPGRPVSRKAPAATKGAARSETRLKVDWLVKPAEQAVIKGQFAKAALLYQGAIALRGQTPKLLWRLAEIYTMGGQFFLAQETYRQWLQVGGDAAKRARAKAEIQRLENAPAPFASDDVVEQARQRSFALKAAGKARRLAKGRRYREAIRYLHAALLMDASLVGAYRLIGSYYQRLRDEKSAQAFYVRYLRQVPGGKLASMVRRRLKAHPKLGRVTFKASFPCRVYINRKILDARRRTPLKGILLPKGEYTVVFYNEALHFGAKHRIQVKAGEPQVVTSDFGVLQVRLKPWARVKTRKEGGRTWRDLGLWEKVGLPAGHFEVDFRSHDGKKHMVKKIHIKPGGRVRITRWE